MNIYRFYVYAYLRENGSPYYIGKGSGKRAYNTQDHCAKPPKDKSKIIFYQTGLLENDAFNLETAYIKLFGRKDNKTGILRNRTDGGEGVSGQICSEEHRRKLSITSTGRTHSEESKQKMSISHTGKILSEEHKRNLSIAGSGKIKSEEHKRKISIAKMGKIKSEETKQNMSKNWKIIFPSGEEIQIKNLSQFCKNNNLHRSCMERVAQGNRHHHKGFKCKKIILCTQSPFIENNRESR